jgi:hypothetical protein
MDCSGPHLHCPFPGCRWTYSVIGLSASEIELIVIDHIEAHGFTADEFRQLHRMERELGR